MRTTIMLVLALAAGCAKKADYKAACEHLIELGKADIEANIAKLGPEMADVGEKLRAQAAATAQSDLETCVRKSEERNVDTRCILDAKTIDEASLCLRR